MIAKDQLQDAADALLTFDRRAEQTFKPYHDTPVVGLLGWFSKLGDQPEVRLLSGTLIVAGILGSNDRLVRAGARMLIAHEAATLAKDVLKTNIDRTRPRSATAGTAKKPKRGSHTAKERTSFPSGHTAGTIAAARAFSREYPEYGAAAIVAAGAIAVTQIVRSAHYPTDVAAGVLTGLAAEAAVDGVWRATAMEQRSES